jgi:4-amino-4-deoxy-L-arabinose transferase-like glycosyltransferase
VSSFWAKNKWPLLVALLAFLVRLIYLIELSSRPGFTAPIIDELWHWEWAQQIISGSFWGDEAFFRAPLYPYFLAMLAKLTGSSIFWTKFLQTLLCGGTAVLLFKLAEHLFNRPVAIIAGFFYAFYGTLVFYETMFLIPVLFLFLTVWAMYRLVVHCDSPSWRTWILTGLLLGLETA